jgi:hypothetical protein
VQVTRIKQTAAAMKGRCEWRDLNLFENPSINYYRLSMRKEGTHISSPAERWTRRVGVAAFLFFLIKGILWLIVPAIAAYFALK